MRQRGNIYFILIGALLVIGGLATLYAVIDSRGYKRGQAEVQALWDTANRVQRAKEAAQSSAASTKLEKDNAKSRVVYRTITQTVDKLVDRPIYRNVCLDADGLRDANAALNGGQAPDPGQPDRTVPAALPAAGRNGGVGLAQAGGGERVVLRLRTASLPLGRGGEVGPTP